MAQNYPIDSTLTEEQEAVRRLIALGERVRLTFPGQRLYNVTTNLDRLANGPDGTQVPSPRMTFSITLDLDAQLYAEGELCGHPLWMAVPELSPTLQINGFPPAL